MKKVSPCLQVFFFGDLVHIGVYSGICFVVTKPGFRVCYESNPNLHILGDGAFLDTQG
jgi:hypothetical protein